MEIQHPSQLNKKIKLRHFFACSRKMEQYWNFFTTNFFLPALDWAFSMDYLKFTKLAFPLDPPSLLSAIMLMLWPSFSSLLSLFSSGNYLVSDSFSFVNDLLSSNFNSDNLIMASFDIKSLFTNIPLDETIDIIVTKLFSNSTHFHGFNSDDFTKLLQLSVKNCHFLFNGVLYEQIDGVAMGSPLGPLFADIFLSWHEQNWLELCPSDFKPVLYRRYVDDCFLLFRSNNHINTFLNFLSRQHPNIVFIVENEVNKSLSFLDVKIT